MSRSSHPSPDPSTPGSPRARVLLGALALLAATACGGGDDVDDGSSSPVISSRNTARLVVTTFDETFKQSIEPADLLSEDAVSRLNAAVNGSTSSVQFTCQDGSGNDVGTTTYELDDNDNNNEVSVGDVVTLALDNCLVAGVLNSGEATFSVTAVSNLDGYFGTGVGSYSGTFRFGTLKTGPNRSVTGDIVLAKNSLGSGAARTQGLAITAPQVRITGTNYEAETTGLSQTIVFSQDAARTTSFIQTATTRFGPLGEVTFTVSLADQIVVPAPGSNVDRSGSLRYASDGLALQLILEEGRKTVTVDNGANGVIDFTFVFQPNEL